MRVLIIDKDELNNTTLAPLLDQLGHEHICVSNPDEALSLCLKECFDMVFINVDLIKEDLIRVVSQLKTSCYDLSQWNPVVMLSSQEDDETILEAINAGGDDFIKKPITLRVLEAKIKAIRRIISMRQNLIDYDNQLKIINDKLLSSTELLNALTLKDPLTQIANRRAFQDYFEKVMRGSVRNSTGISILMIDVDHFKDYNDQYGHQEGDQCLIQVSHALSNQLHRPADFIGRFGGEEFAIILPETELVDACFVAERLRQAVTELKILHQASVLGFVTVSIGVACAHPYHNFDGQLLIEASDQALYRAKDQGRNCIFFCAESVETLSQLAKDSSFSLKKYSA